MRDFEGYRIIALAALLGELTRSGADEQVVTEQWKLENLDAMRAFYPGLLQMGMDASHSSLERMVQLLEQPNVQWRHLANIAAELKGRLQDQAQRRQIFALTYRESEFAMRPRAGWETALDRFPEIVPDVDEASYCLALSRYPASVYHSVQISEAGLIELGTFLKVKDPHSGWTSVASALEKVIDKSHSERTTFERKNFASLEQIQATVQALKNAWRNKISHAHGRLILLKTDFGFERAEEILTATRAFMRRLAEDLPPAKNRKTSLADITETEDASVEPRDPAGQQADPSPPQTQPRTRQRKARGRS